MSRPFGCGGIFSSPHTIIIMKSLINLSPNYTALCVCFFTFFSFWYMFHAIPVFHSSIIILFVMTLYYLIGCIVDITYSVRALQENLTLLISISKTPVGGLCHIKITEENSLCVLVIEKKIDNIIESILSIPK